MEKRITYFKSYQEFEEVVKHDDGTETIKRDTFRKPELKEKVIFNKKATIVILDDGSKGVSKCDPIDDFDKTKGVKIAYLRAKIKSLIKELKVLTGKKYKLKLG